MTTVPPVRSRVRAAPVIAPPARTRGPIPTIAAEPVAPRVRTRPAPTGGESPWHIPAGCRPLGVLQKTHNGVNPTTGELPDPRFKPLLIIMQPSWRTGALPAYIGHRFERDLSWKVADVAKQDTYVLTTAYIGEWILRHNLGYRAMAEDVFDELREILTVRFRLDKKDPLAITEVHRAMFSIDPDDGDLLVDITKNTGPFHCDAALGIEHHYKKRLQQVAR